MEIRDTISREVQSTSLFQGVPTRLLGTKMGSTAIFRQSINDFPEELALKVISQVADRSTLYNLLFSSKRIYRITLPILYRSIDHQMYKHPPMIHSAVRTLLLKPELARKVEMIGIRDPKPCQQFWDLKSWGRWAKAEYRAKVHEDDEELFLAGSQHLLSPGLLESGLPTLEHLMEKEEAQVALLISLCPNVKRFLLENPSTPTESPRFVLDYLVLQILHPQIRDGKLLQNLEYLTTVTERLEGGQGGFRLSSIATFFLLPNLRRVKGVACFEPEDDLFEDFECPIATSSVRELRFFRSAVCPKGLSQTIGACKALEVFGCDWAGLNVGWVEINFPLLTGALLEQKRSLHRVRLNTAKHFNSWPERDDGLVPPFGKHLKEFDRLKTLDVPASALIGWDENNVGGYDRLRDVLPRNIEDLKINEFAPRLLEMIDDFASVCTEFCPLLRKLIISRRHADVDVEDGLKEKFAKLAPDVKLLFVDGEEVNHFDSSIDGSI
ncbi:hypothetical protein EJ08DRAFT_733995 [Tothia fuscella]|uniref:F-box domain-containing protein n=1 Tax=Tothia fuscella TaxID=1048955 RepID=A0A9P4TZC1_9PEZI|nr:hypothetical protein EJ08DRAFT_733995 [Tothia fuscella]